MIPRARGLLQQAAPSKEVVAETPADQLDDSTHTDFISAPAPEFSNSSTGASASAAAVASAGASSPPVQGGKMPVPAPAVSLAVTH